MRGTILSILFARIGEKIPESPEGEIPNGGVAQLGEHLPCKQGVRGSNPLISTKGGTEEGQQQGLIAQLVRAPA